MNVKGRLENFQPGLLFLSDRSKNRSLHRADNSKTFEWNNLKTSNSQGTFRCSIGQTSIAQNPTRDSINLIIRNIVFLIIVKHRNYSKLIEQTDISLTWITKNKSPCHTMHADSFKKPFNNINFLLTLTNYFQNGNYYYAKLPRKAKRQLQNQCRKSPFGEDCQMKYK